MGTRYPFVTVDDSEIGHRAINKHFELRLNFGCLVQDLVGEYYLKFDQLNNCSADHAIRISAGLLDIAN